MAGETVRKSRMRGAVAQSASRNAPSIITSPIARRAEMIGRGLGGSIDVELDGAVCADKDAVIMQPTNTAAQSAGDLFDAEMISRGRRADE